MAISRTQRDGCTVLTLSGALDGLRSNEVRNAIEKLLADRAKGVICDVQSVPHGTVGLNIFLVVAALANKWPETWIALACREPGMLDRLRRLKISDRIPVYPSVDQALQNLGRRPLVQLDTRHIPRHPGAPRQAREFVGAACERWGIGHLTTNAGIAVTELVNNAFQHTADRFVEVRVGHSPQGLRISVGDGSPIVPPAAPIRMHRGRLTGLGAVSLVSISWGVLPTTAGGKLVWCLLRDERGDSWVGQ